MSKSQIIDILVPTVSVVGLLFGMWCGWKRKWLLLTLGLLAWFIFSVCLDALW